MGAAAGVEVHKPTDASDIANTGDLTIARGEVMRLRNLLGQYAKDAGFLDVTYDASDLVLGENDEDDFDRCIDEIIHIRTACRMATQKSRRQRRVQVAPSNCVADRSSDNMVEDGKSGESDDSDDSYDSDR